VESTEPRRESTLPEVTPVGDAIASNTRGSILSMRSSATTTCPRKTTGSPSASSTDTHANGRRSRSAHSASRVVFPYPAGEVIETIEAVSDARRRSTSSLRRTIPDRIGGRKSFASVTSNTGDPSARSGARLRATCRIVPLPIPAAQPSGFFDRAFLDSATPSGP
jgi:hypothetical protein